MELPGGVGYRGIRVDVERKLDEETARAQGKLPAGFRFVVHDGWEDQFQRLPMQFGEAAKMAAPFALVPPLFLLIVGLAVAWVVKGFAKREAV